MILKNVLVFLFLATIVCGAGAQTVELEEKIECINYVDNQRNLVVIGDMEYKLKIGTKVTDDTGRQLNRYALKPEQTVVINGYYEKSQAYLDTIVILKKKLQK